MKYTVDKSVFELNKFNEECSTNTLYLFNCI